MRRSGHWRAAPAVLAVGLVMAVTGGVAWSAIPNSNTGVITACVKDAAPEKGKVRIIDAQAGATCVAGESKITWDGDELRWTGAWSATTAYRRGDVVVVAGSSYLARLANTGVPVTNTTNWGVLAEKGDEGPVGPAGPTGPPGPVGPAGPSTVVAIGQSSRSVTLPGTYSSTWTFLGVPFPIDVRAGDVVDVEGIFNGYNEDSSGGLQTGICWRRRAPGAAVAGPADLLYEEFKQGDWFSPVAIRALRFGTDISVEVGYCVRYVPTTPSDWVVENVKLTVRHIRGAALLPGSN